MSKPKATRAKRVELPWQRRRRTQGSLREYFHQYPYRNNEGWERDELYLQESEKSDHVHTLTFKEWKVIIIAYLTNLIWFLQEGLPYVIPQIGGTLRLMKKRGPIKNYRDQKKPPEEEGEFYGRMLWKTSGYYPFLVWQRSPKTPGNRGAAVRSTAAKWSTLTLSRKLYFKIFDSWIENPELKFKLPDTNNSIDL